jgi:hypothetical protein
MFAMIRRTLRSGTTQPSGVGVGEENKENAPTMEIDGKGLQVKCDIRDGNADSYDHIRPEAGKQRD